MPTLYTGEFFSGEHWQKLANAGGRPQRLLWASSGNKNPDYRDSRYIEELIGPDTVVTMPLATIEAFRNHGNVQPTLERRPEQALYMLEALAEASIDMDSVALQLEEEGILKFEILTESCWLRLQKLINQ